MSDERATINGFTAVIIDDYPAFSVSLDDDWVGIHIENAGNGFAKLFWFKNPSLDSEGCVSFDDCVYEDGSEVPECVYQQGDDAWNDVLLQRQIDIEDYYDG